MRCPYAHKWVILWEKSGGSLFANRRCKRCGTMQRGTYDPLSRFITWRHLESTARLDTSNTRLSDNPPFGSTTRRVIEVGKRAG